MSLKISPVFFTHARYLTMETRPNASDGSDPQRNPGGIAEPQAVGSSEADATNLAADARNQPADDSMDADGRRKTGKKYKQQTFQHGSRIHGNKVKGQTEHMYVH